MNPLLLGWLARWGLWSLVVAAALGAAWLHGARHEADKFTAFRASLATQAVQLRALQRVVVRDVRTKYEVITNTIYTTGGSNAEQVPALVTAADNAECRVPVGFVRSFNAGWTGAAAGAASGADRESSGVSLADVAAASAENATSCLVYRTQRDGVIELYNKLRQAQLLQEPRQ